MLIKDYSSVEHGLARIRIFRSVSDDKTEPGPTQGIALQAVQLI